MTLLENIEQYIEKHALIERNNTIIIGLSGGPDSVFLLHMLIALQKKYNLTLITAYLNHEWRAEADSEEQMCRNLSAQHNIPFVSAKLSSLEQPHKYNGSKEEFARNMRRQFLESVAREHHADSIALGHHAQDQQETFFIRLIRGTSLAGLTGMEPRAGIYIRPLLQNNKSDILQWLAENKITYAHDMSNESSDYLRNRIRATVLPALEQCDERWNNNFLTTLNRLKQDDALLDEITRTTLNNLIVTTNAVKQTKRNNLLPARPDASTVLSSKHPPALRSLGEGRVEGYLRAHLINKNHNSKNLILNHFSRNQINFFQKKIITKNARRYPSTSSVRAGRRLNHTNKKPHTTNNQLQLNTLQFANTHPSLRHRIIMQWLIQNNVPFPTTSAFLDEIIRFICGPNGGTHAIHEEWSLVKKQNKASIIKLSI